MCLSRPVTDTGVLRPPDRVRRDLRCKMGAEEPSTFFVRVWLVVSFVTPALDGTI